MDLLHPSKRGKKELCKCVKGLKCSYCKWLKLSETSTEDSLKYQVESLQEEVKRLKKERKRTDEIF